MRIPQPPAPVSRCNRAPGALAVRPDRPIRLAVTNGRLTHVEIAAGGVALPGALAADARSWQASAVPRTATTYQVTAEALGPGGTASLATSFTTVTPRRLLRASVSPLNGQTVGVGLPLAVFFNVPVTDRAAVERRLNVTTKPAVRGAWHWFHDNEVHFRPQKYWAPGTRVTLHADLAGVDNGHGVWGAPNRVVSYRIGASHVSTVNLATHVMTVTANGRVVRRFPISGGRPQYQTKSGISVVIEKSAKQRMDSTTAGITGRDAYNVTVAWATRISYSGEFVHAAPWSVAAQGHANVSHGCVNASIANAKWFYDFSVRGDVVEVTGSSVKLRQGNGFADWNLSWQQWLAGSTVAVTSGQRVSPADGRRSCCPTTPADPTCGPRPSPSRG